MQSRHQPTDEAFMSTMSLPALSSRLSRILMFDAATCAVMGVALLMASEPLGRILALPADLLFHAGFALMPIAAFVAWISMRRPVFPAGTWAVIVGNIGWVIASVAVLLLPFIAPNLLGAVFVLAQAAAVAILAAMEWRALERG
jgi:hypothetical protein